ncbi:MAG: hypothetical protein C5S47_03510 [Candidatus Methanogasteraceae archaeon]|nr:MAG: hypothetical protein C5S47_03510 [ANME-2 cluster archaeon]
MIACALTGISDPVLYVMGTTALAMLLFVSEVLSTTNQWKRGLSDSFNISILPLLVLFLAIVISEVRAY